MKKPEFKMDIEEMIEFQDGCDAAASHCMQYDPDYYCIDDRKIFRGKQNPANLLKHWAESGELWEFGYDKFLDEDTLKVFKRYHVYRAELAIWELENE